MKFLYNPLNGAPIEKVWFEGTKYFHDEPFAVNTVIQIEESLSDFLVKIYGFLRVVDKNEALKLSEQKEVFTCECGFKTTTKIALAGHKRSHDSNPDYIPGIKTVAVEKKEMKVAGSKDDLTQNRWEEQDKASGLEGEGLVRDTL